MHAGNSAASAESTAAALAVTSRTCLRALLQLPTAIKYMQRTHAAFVQLRLRLHRAAVCMQRFHRRTVAPYVFRRFWGAVGLPLAFVIGLRVHTKRLAARKIACTLLEHPHPPFMAHIHSFRRRVAAATHQVRSFLQVNAARKELVRRLWARQEASVRRTLALRERQKVERLKAEQKARLLAQAGEKRKGAGNTHAKWLRRAEEVRLLLARSDAVQMDFRNVRNQSDRLLGLADAAFEGASREDEEGGGEDSPPASAAEKEKEKEKEKERLKLKEAELEVIPAEERDQIIGRLVSLKRTRHIRNVVLDSEQRTKTRGVVDAAGVRAFLKEQAPKAHKSRRRASMAAMSAHQTEGLHRLNKVAADSDLPRLRRGFLMLTDPELGAAWPRLVFDAVHAYMSDPDK